MLEREIDKVTGWLQEQVDAANANGLVVGVSGGIDSAVAAALIAGISRQITGADSSHQLGSAGCGRRSAGGGKAGLGLC